jgi:hypothetical protein
MAVSEAWVIHRTIGPHLVRQDKLNAVISGRVVDDGPIEVVPADAYKVMIDQMVEVRLMAEKLRRSSVASERSIGAELQQVIDS